MKTLLFFIPILCLASCSNSLDIETPRKEQVTEVDTTQNHQESSELVPTRYELQIEEIMRVSYSNGGGESYSTSVWNHDELRSELLMLRQDNDDLHLSANLLLRAKDAFTRYGITEIELRLGGINSVGRKTINAQPQGSSFVRVVFRPIENYPGSTTVTQYVPADLEFVRPAGDNSHIQMKLNFDLGIPLPSSISPGSANMLLDLFFDQ